MKKARSNYSGYNSVLLLNAKRLDYASARSLRSGATSTGQYSYAMTESGYVFACDMYANTLGNTAATNNIYCVLFVNAVYITDSQSFTAKERGGAMCVPVHAGDTVTFSVINKALDNMTLTFVPFATS